MFGSMGMPPVVAHLMADIGEFAAKMGEADAMIQGVTGRGARSWSKMGKQAMGIGLVMVAASGALGYETVKMASAFQTQMERVHTQAGASQAEVDSLNNKVLALAGATGQGPEKLAEALYHIESVGYRGAAAMSVLNDASKLATISGANLDDTTYGLTSVMQSYGAKAQDSAKWAAFFNGVVGIGDMRMQDFVKSVGTGFFSAAQTFGMSAQSAGAALAFMTDRGQHADSAATHLRMSLALMAAPSAKATSILKSLGLASHEAATKQQLAAGVLGKAGITYSRLAADLRKPDGFLVALQDLKKHLMASGLTADAANAQLSHAFGGGKSDSTILAMLNNLGTLGQKYDALGKASKTYGSSWAAAQKTFAVETAKAKAGLEAFGIQIGNVLMPYVEKFVGWLAKASQYLTTHKDAAKAAALIIGTVFVAGLAIATAGMLAFAIASIAATWEIMLIIAAVMLVVAGIILLATHWTQVWNWIKEKTREAVGWVGEHLSRTWKAIAADANNIWQQIVRNIVGAWSDIASWFSSAWHTVTDPIVRGWNSLVADTNNIWQQIVRNVVGAWSDIASWFSSAWHDATDPIVKGWGVLERVTKQVWGAILGFFKTWWPLLLVIFAFPVAVMMALWNHFHTAVQRIAITVWGAISQWLKSTWSAISSDAAQAWGWIRDHIYAPVAQVVGLVMKGVGVLVSWLVGAWKNIERGAAVAWDFIVVTTKVAWAMFYRAIIQPVQNAYGSVVHFMQQMGQFIRNQWHTVASWTSSAWNGIYNTVARWLGVLLRAVGLFGSSMSRSITGAFNSVLSWLGGVGSWFYGVGSGIVQGIINGVSGAGGALFGTLRNLASGALSAAKSFLGINSPSRLFADHVGRAIPEGIAKGINDHADLAHSAVRGLSAGMPLGGASSFALAGAGAGLGGGGGTIYLNLVTEAKVDTGVLFRTTQTHALKYQKQNGRPAFSFSR